MALGTGHGTTIAFTTSSWTGSVVSIGSSEQTREMLDASHLGTATYRAKVVADLVDPGGFDIEYLYDPMGDLPPITAVAETITITIGGAGGAILAGTGAFTSISTPELVTGDLMKGSGHVEWATGPTYTKDT